MTAVMDLVLCAKPAAAHWGDNALISFEANQVNVHVTSQGASRLQDIQKAARKLDAQGLKHLSFIGDSWDVEACWAFYQGYYNAKQDNQLEIVVLSDADLAKFNALKAAADWTRKTINLGPAAIYPQTLCESAAKFLTELAPEHVSHNIISGEDLLTEGWVGTYQVGKGSSQAPAMLQLDYNPSGNPDEPVAIALVGKGITFDSGGYSIKPSDGMSIMKSDMGGAATVTGGLGLAIANGLNKRVKLFLCCAENMVSGDAYKLGDVITYKNGVTVEVLNTDAEGRLVLADGLIAASELKPGKIIDAATLTGAAKMALGRDYNAVFGFDDDLVHQALQAAKAENEKAWALPLEPFHKGQIGSSFADIANISCGEGMAGASTAAAFLAHFVEKSEQNWLHFDLSGSYQKSGNALWATGAKGHGIRTISRLLSE
ncbi:MULTISPECIES: aminopeptidase PepB [unclassified Agarivorans]|uniref:aminopeptidase PepB n=1 Tax=unclassified Agarivorans TaxID=2636026 RepID=UPI0026E3BB26|nr:MULTISPECIES: aminopeptidase PepB [unclassified Agarivorans]MDO6687328.1 aminopeptidase PepB [Agarivorans sp. 3_MG-2023]MDO6716986.1 aminopeptidase PepB [Agarivorans sp. 2_MG-2023]